jgi:hypothetical protein
VSFVAPSAALVPSVAPHAAPMPSVAPRAALVPPTGPHAAPVPPDAPFADPVPPATPRAAPTPPTRYTELLQVYRHRTMPASAQDPPTLAPKVPARYAHPESVYATNASTTSLSCGACRVPPADHPSGSLSHSSHGDSAFGWGPSARDSLRH